MSWKLITKAVKKASRTGEKTLRKAEKVAHKSLHTGEKALRKAEKVAHKSLHSGEKATYYAQKTISVASKKAGVAAPVIAEFFESEPGKEICGKVGATVATVLIPEGGFVSAKVGQIIGEKVGEEVSKGLRQV